MLFILEMACIMGSGNHSRINNTVKQTNCAETNVTRVQLVAYNATWIIE